MISRKTTKIATLLAILSIAGFFIYQGIAGSMKINMPVTNDLTSGLVGHWTFDGQDTNWGTNWTNDRSGQGNNGAMTNMAITTSPAPGVIGQALNFDGTDDYVLADPTNWSGNFTVSLWVKAASSGHNLFESIFSNNINIANTFQIDVEEPGGGDGSCNFSGLGGFRFFAKNSSSSNFQLCFNDITTTWEHLVVAVNGTNITIYQNGAFQQSSIQDFNASFAEYKIGINRGNSSFFSGLIDEVRVYNRALSAGEITELYNQGAKRLLKANMPGTNRLTSGLVGYWTMDGNNTTWTSATAGTVTDSSGNGNTGTLTNMSQSTSPAIGKVGQALYFDGSNDYVNVGDPASGILDFTDAFSVSLWAKKASFPNVNARIIDKRGESDAGYFFRFNADNSANFYTETTGADQLLSTTLFNTTDWYYLTFTRDSSGVKKIYVNGVEDASSTHTGDLSNTRSFYIGSSGFNGLIDEVRVYNRALSASEITELYNQGAARLIKTNMPDTSRLTSGLVGYWTFDGQDTNWGTNTTNDRSGNGYNGTITNMSTTTSPVPGVAGQALNFDGVNDYVDLGSGTSLDLNNFTISVWFKLNALPVGGFGIVAAKSFASNNPDDWRMMISTAGVLSIMIRNSAGTVYYKATSATVAAGRWYHWTMVYDNTNLKSYMNGVYSDGRSASGGVRDSVGSKTYIGRDDRDSGGFTYGFNGIADEVRVYNRALSASEVSELYQQGRR